MNVSPGDLRRILLPKILRKNIALSLCPIHMHKRDGLIEALYHKCGMDEGHAAG